MRITLINRILEGLAKDVEFIYKAIEGNYCVEKQELIDLIDTIYKKIEIFKKLEK